MKNFVQENTQITVEAPKDVRSGELVVIGSLIGVANTDINKGGKITLTTQGIFEFDCKTRFQVGDEVHIKDGSFVPKATGTLKVGICTAYIHDKVRVRLV